VQRWRHTSIRTQLLGIVLLGAILPLALIGFWLTGSAVRSGEQLLSDQLDSSLTNVGRLVASRWEYRGGHVQWMADNANARDALARGAVSAADSQFFVVLAREVQRDIPRFAYRDRGGRVLYEWTRPDAVDSAPLSDNAAFQRRVNATAGAVALPRRIAFLVTIPVVVSTDTVGHLEARVWLDAVVPPDSAQRLVPGSRLAIRNRRDGTVLKSLWPSDSFPVTSEIVAARERWLVRHQQLDEPPLDLAMGAPAAAYVAPFEHAGVIGIAALLAVALSAVVLSGFLTSRLAASVASLVRATGAVAAGDLAHDAKPSGPAEIRQLAASFNAMTGSLRSLMHERAQRRALAAVGEFAAALSHEVRNALTSVQIDLERVDERTEDEKNRQLLSRTLAHVRRLDAAVTGSLRVARSGHVVPVDVSVRGALRRAISAADANYAATHARLVPPTAGRDVVVSGDAEALHQLFLNLLLNAQQSLAPGGEVVVQLTQSEREAVITIADTGCGMSTEQLGRVFEPFFSTRGAGTGLGLPIARQIAIAHGGELTLASTPGSGTVVTVRLPVSRTAPEPMSS
jgi:signal transduction histidine kinase